MIRKESLQSAQVHWPRLLLVAVAILLPACSDSLEDHPPLYPVKGKVIRNGKPMTIRPQSHQSFLAGFALYKARSDKRYSLTDCISMEAMRDESITEVLTHDNHFTQEGFSVLLLYDSAGWELMTSRPSGQEPGYKKRKRRAFKLKPAGSLRRCSRTRRPFLGRRVIEGRSSSVWSGKMLKR
jgi:hypothetical protein